MQPKTQLKYTGDSRSITDTHQPISREFMALPAINRPETIMNFK